LLPAVRYRDGSIAERHRLEEAIDAVVVAQSIDLRVMHGDDVWDRESSVLRFYAIVAFENSLVGIPANHSAGARPG